MASLADAREKPGVRPGGARPPTNHGRKITAPSDENDVQRKPKHSNDAAE